MHRSWQPWLLALVLSLPGPVRAEITLDAAARAHLESLTPVAAGTGLDTGSLAGGPLVVTFFASWCPPCLEEFRHLNTLEQEFTGQGLRIVAVNVFEQFDDNDVARMQRFRELTRPRFPLVKGTAETRRRFGDVARIPTVFVFRGDGRPAMHFIHRRGATKMTATLEELRAAVREALGS